MPRIRTLFVTLFLGCSAGCASIVFEPGVETLIGQGPVAFERPLAQLVVHSTSVGSDGAPTPPGVSETFSRSAAQNQKMADSTSGSTSDRYASRAALDRQTARNTAALDTGMAAYGALAAVGQVLREQRASEIGGYLVQESSVVGEAAPPGSVLTITVDHQTASSPVRNFWNGCCILLFLGIPPIKGYDDYWVTAELSLPDGTVIRETKKTTATTYMGWTRSLIIPKDSKAVGIREFHEGFPTIEDQPYPNNLFIFLGRAALRDVADRAQTLSQDASAPSSNEMGQR